MADLDLTYFDPKAPGALSGFDKFYRANKNKATRREVTAFLRAQEPYTLHKPIRFKYKRNQVVVSGIDSQWDADLMDMTQQPDDGFRFLLVVIDILSRYAWTRPLKTKTTKDVSQGFDSIFQEGRVCRTVRTDAGQEFAGKTTQQLFRKYKVHHFVTTNEVKANYAERLIRTLKLRLKRFETWKQSREWVRIMPDITDSYNHTYHRTIKMKPASVTEDNQADVWMEQYTTRPIQKPDGKFKLEVGDFVRISHLRRPFQREYDERYTGEIFKINTRRVRGGLNIYTLADWHGDPVVGTFYEPELQHITADPDGVYKLEKVVRSRKRRGVEKEFLVRWRHWPAKFDSWVKESDLIELQQ